MEATEQKYVLVLYDYNEQRTNNWSSFELQFKWINAAVCDILYAGRNILMTYISGDSVRAVAGKSEKELVEMCHGVLQKLFSDQVVRTILTTTFKHKLSAST